MRIHLSPLRFPLFIVAQLLLMCQSGIAATQPVSEQLEQTGTPVYTSLSKANHVFGYKFRVMEDGQINQLGGYFAGNKVVVIVNDNKSIVASVSVPGNSTGFQWASLQTPLPVETGTIYQVLVRTGADQTSAAAWSLSMPFTRGGIEVLSLQQGWSSNTNPQTWTQTAQTLPGQHARGIVDIGFIANNEPLQPTEPPDDVDPGQPPTESDPFPDTAGVVDSFGQRSPSGRLGMGFMAIQSYYRDFPRQNGECSQEVHDRYWVMDSAGVTHPTWHPPVDPVTGCRFAHEHGDDPRTSPNYVFAQGIPFGVTHGHSDGLLMRHEDHVGHKVVVQSNWELVDGNPQNGSQPGSDAIRRTGTQCDWLSKIHQGSWSRDALANNAHEYFLNLRCTDGVQLRLKQLITFGPPELVTNICNGPSVNQAQALFNPGRTSEAFPSGVTATSGTAVVDPLDGKREFACIDNLLWKNRLEELWKSDGVIKLPSGGFIHFSPYYVVLNPARYLDHRWAERGARDGYVSSLDLCFNDNAAFRSQPMGYCNTVPAELGQLDSRSRQRDIRNPMNGTRRVIHPKNVVVYSENESGSGESIVFCTNRLGRDARIPDTGNCRSNEIEQMVSRSDRRQWGWSGSDVNSITVNGQLRGAGYLNEWVRDFNAPGVRFPN
ncbi:MAG: DUF4082 domain-containing protein [Granulosicoccus sp.]